MDTCFSESEARSQIGTEVLTVEKLPEVPIGTHGRVVDAVQGGARGWLLRIEWALPPKRSEILAQVGELSVNIPWRSKVPKAELSKGDVERLLRQS